MFLGHLYVVLGEMSVGLLPIFRGEEDFIYIYIYIYIYLAA